MAWAGSIDSNHFANPFGAAVDGYKAGRKAVYDEALKAVQIRDHIQKQLPLQDELPETKTPSPIKTRTKPRTPKAAHRLKLGH